MKKLPNSLKYQHVVIGSALIIKNESRVTLVLWAVLMLSYPMSGMGLELSRFACVDQPRCLVLEVGKTKKIMAKDIVKIQVDNAHIVAINKEPLSQRLLLVAKLPGQTYLNVDSLTSPVKERIKIIVYKKIEKVSRHSKQNTKFKRGSLDVESIMELPGWE